MLTRCLTCGKEFKPEAKVPTLLERSKCVVCRSREKSRRALREARAILAGEEVTKRIEEGKK